MFTYLGRFSYARVDRKRTLVGTTYSHDAVHEDIIIQAEDYATGVSTARDYLLVTDAVLENHLVFRVSCSHACRIQVFEGATTSANGTAIRIARLNRKSSKTIATGVFVAPTVTATGDEIPGAWLAGGTGGNAQGGSFAHTDAEWLLKDETKYLFRLTPAAAATVSIQFEFYEVSPYAG
jgi:hypothetical protein